MRFGRVGALGLIGLGSLLLCATAASAQATHVLIVTGVSGEPRFAQQFERDASLMRDALSKRFNASVRVLTEKSTPRADKAGIAEALQALARSSKAGDQVLIILIGHGSAQGGTARFNIPGPDITAAELARSLEQFGGRELAIVAATSASGAFAAPLAADGRVIITATRSAAESEEVVFPQHFAKALSEDVADIDKDGAVSLAEAYEYTKREVERSYKQQNRLATEHATLGGADAAQFVLRAGSGNAADPRLRSLHAERASLQQQIAVLKANKASMGAAEYEAALEKLLVQLALKQQQIRAAEKK